MLTAATATLPSGAARLAERRWRRGPVLLMLGLGAGLGASDATAAMGSLATSTGLVATLLAVFAMKGWPTITSASTVSTAGGALLVAGAVAWLVPHRANDYRTALRAFLSWLGRRHTASSRRSIEGGLRDGALESEMTALFLAVHQAWDRAEFDALGASMTTDMLDEVMHARGHGASFEVWRSTDIVTVRADIKSLEQLGTASLASVVFSGTLREGAAPSDTPFRELWLVIRSDAPKAPWKLARHQALY